MSALAMPEAPYMVVIPPYGEITFLPAGPTIDSEAWNKAKEVVQGYVEPVHVLYQGSPAWLLVNEAGWLRDMPYNPQATNLYHGHRRGEKALVSQTEQGHTIDLNHNPLHDTPIAGPVVLCVGMNME